MPRTQVKARFHSIKPVSSVLQRSIGFNPNPLPSLSKGKGDCQAVGIGLISCDRDAVGKESDPEIWKDYGEGFTLSRYQTCISRYLNQSYNTLAHCFIGQIYGSNQG